LNFQRPLHSFEEAFSFASSPFGGYATIQKIPSPLPLCGIPTSIFFAKEERDVSGEKVG
jgi:hypothetical protein